MAKFRLNIDSRPAVYGQQPERVRIGSISVFALVVVICLAVLAVLSISTANASLTMSQRQATATTELYLDERAAQEFLAGIDDVLANVRSATAATDVEPEIEFALNEWGNVAYDDDGFMVIVEKDPAASAAAAATAGAKEGAAAAASAGADAEAPAANAGARAVEAALPGICDDARAATAGQVQVSATMSGNRVGAEFTCENGRILHIVATIRANGTYRIDRWKMSAVQNEEEAQGQFWISD